MEADGLRHLPLNGDTSGGRNDTARDIGEGSTLSMIAG